MPDGQVLEFTRVTKRFNDVTAVSDFSARIEPGAVTAFLGPNGAGKTTTLRILLGQVRATSGTATIGGVAYSELRHPLRTIGSVLEETSYRPRRSAARLLTMAAKANGIPLARVGEVLALVGLENEAEGRVGSFSLGMRQRLSVAHALLGDPGALVFDEPANGLDPEGIRWMRLLMRRLADEGRTVLVSSHVLSEVEQVADNVLVLSKGHLMLSSGIEKLADPSAGSVVVDAADRAALRAALLEAGFQIEVLRSGLRARGGDAARVGAVAASAGIALTTLVQRGPTLEDVFIELVRGGTLEPRAAVAASEYVVADEVTGGAGVDAQPVSGDVEAVAETDDESLAVAETDAGASTDADAEPVTEAEPASDVVDEVTPTSAAPEADIEGGPSFDDILFGAGSAQIETGAAEDEAADGSPESGVEVFAGLGTADDADDVAAAAEPDEQRDDESDEQVDDESGEQADDASGEQTDDDADPRSAAVSSMLAAAARAYYEDEPRDYPHGDASTAEEQTETGERDAQWSVAATGVIDQVPAWAPSEGIGGAGAGAQQEGVHEHHEGDHEHHEGDHEHHEGDHEHHEGDHEHHHY
ncbi:ATP-binding cassette domain-containing protein [Microbacterium sp. CR_7]|uniref:ABC transporter ATP-binding protein n=1 Tax=Microbacterium sp. CR_7 TaxID=3055792 RepID=UPI0035C1E928